MEEKERTGVKVKTPRWARNAGLIVVTSLVAGAGVGLLWFAGCVWNRNVVPLCRHPAGGWVFVIGAMALVWLWSASYLHERLRKRLRRGMYSYGGSAWSTPGAGLVENVVHLVVEGEWPEGRGARAVAMYDRRGWWVDTPVDDGTRVWVPRQAMWEWLIEVVAIHRGDAAGLPDEVGRSAIAQRRWEGPLGRAQWWARCWLLWQVAAIEQTTADPRSRRLVRTDASRMLEDIEAVVGLSEQR